MSKSRQRLTELIAATALVHSSIAGHGQSQPGRHSNGPGILRRSLINQARIPLLIIVLSFSDQRSHRDSKYICTLDLNSWISSSLTPQTSLERLTGLPSWIPGSKTITSGSRRRWYPRCRHGHGLRRRFLVFVAIENDESRTKLAEIHQKSSKYIKIDCAKPRFWSFKGSGDQVVLSLSTANLAAMQVQWHPHESVQPGCVLLVWCKDWKVQIHCLGSS